MSEYRKVVVTGIGAVTPLGNNAAETWEGMKSGKNGIAPITLFDTENFKAKLAAEVKGFDPRAYLEVNEVLRTDRYARFAVAAAKQAADESGIDGAVDPDRFAVIFGTGIGGISTFEKEHSTLMEKGPRRVSPLMVPMMISNMAAGMIAIRHDCRGSVMPAVTACASGSNAIGEAMRLIRHGYADAAITGGAEAAIIPSAIAGFANMKALSVAENPEEASLPFDKRRGGFVMGEGSCTLVLEEYEHALERGAKIYAEIVGIGLSADAYHITAPHPEGLGGVIAMTNALKNAGISPDKIDYINAHATSTPIGDLPEIIAIQKVFGEHAYKLNISSTKSEVGHLLGAAGAIESMFCIFSINESIVPPTINHKQFDEKIDRNLNLTLHKAQNRNVDYAMSNAFGFSGHNTSIIFKKMDK